MTELNFIFNHFAKLAKSCFVNDGCAISVPNNKKLVTTKDILISNVHFFRDDSPNSIAQKSLRKNLSDLAAMGADPYGYMLGISLPQHTDEKFIIDFCKGLSIVGSIYNLDLFGGDTTSNYNDMIIVSITMFGLADLENDLMPRNNARAGQKIYVSGTIGKGYLGLLARKGEIFFQNNDSFLNHYLFGNCRNDIVCKIIGKASACIDISDGLLKDLKRICKASNISAKIYSDKIPHVSGFQLNDLISHGDDFELLFCSDNFIANECDDIVEIGEMIPEHGGNIYLDNILVNDINGFEHFK